MNYTRATLHEAARLIGSLAVICGLIWAVGKPHAEDLINSTVEDKLHSLEQKIDDAQFRMSGAATQMMVQQKQLENIVKSQDESRTDIREIQRNMTLILRELRRD
jgi:hypothetical protein